MHGWCAWVVCGWCAGGRAGASLGERAGCGCFCVRLSTSTNAAGTAPGADGEWHAPAATGQFLRSFVCVSVFQFHATTVRHQNVFSAPALQVRVRYARARVYARVHDDPFSPPPLHFKNVKEPFASTVRGSMKPGPSPRSVVKSGNSVSGNSVSTTLASAPLGVRGGSPRERLPSGGWVGCVC